MPNNNTNGNSAPQQWGAQFGFPTNGQVLPNGTDPATGHASAASAGDAMSGSFVDPNGIVGGLFNDIMGFTSQNREFAHEEYMTEKYETAEARMQHAINAGINPLTAAAGIAGSSGSASAAGSATPTGISDLGNAVAAVGGLPSANRQRNAAAELDSASAGAIPTQLEQGKWSVIADLGKAFAAIGCPEVAAACSALGVGKGTTQSITSFLEGDGVIREYDRRMNLLKEQIKVENDKHKMFLANLENVESSTNLNDKNAALAAEKERHEKVLRELDQFEVESLNGLHSDPRWSQWSALWYTYEKFGLGSDEYNNALKVVTDFMFSQQQGTSSAERMFGTAKSPWELGDKYVHRLVQWIRGNGEDNSAVMVEQLNSLATQLQQLHPSWDQRDIEQELLRMGFTSDDLVKARGGK